MERINGMSQRYTLHIHGSIPVSFAEGEPLPTTQDALRDLLEDYDSMIKFFVLDGLPS